MKDFSDLIDKICEDNLTAAEQLEADKLLQENAHFARQLQAQRDILHYLEHQENKKRLEGYHQQLLQGDENQNLYWLGQSRWLVAASLLLFVSIASFAIITIVKPFQAKEREQPVMVDNNFSQKRDAQGLKIQLYTLAGDQDLLLTSEQGIEIFFPAGSILKASGNLHEGTFDLELMEVQAQDQIHNISNLTITDSLQLIYIGLDKMQWQINPQNPPLFRQIDKAWYGNFQDSKISFNPLIKSTTVVAPDQEMLDYQRYRESKILLDSIGKYYRLNGERYELKNTNSKRMTLQADFIAEIKVFVKTYEQKPAFEMNKIYAEKQWNLYDKQHQLIITPQNQPGILQLPILSSGWYAVEKK